MSGYIYIFSNPYMQKLYKIGMTLKDVEARRYELQTTGVPFPFEIEFAMKVENPNLIEKFLHKAYDKQRVNSGREFFKLTKPELDSIKEFCISSFKGEVQDITSFTVKESPDENAEEGDLEFKQENILMEQEREVRARGTLKDLGIKAGEELLFIKDISIKCKVVNDKEVEYNGELFSLSKLAKKLLQDKFNWKSGNVNGFRFFTYENELLWDRRLRFEDLKQ